MTEEDYVISEDSGLYKLDSFKSEEKMTSLSTGNYTSLIASFTVDFVRRLIQ